jgi:A-factor type gamma-butyrolactone 1'-reductase (1S-forming)
MLIFLYPENSVIVPLMTHSGKVALVTRADSGLGQATALASAATGGPVLAVDIDPATAALITRASGSAVGHAADVSIEAEGAEAVARRLRAFGGLDLAFNDAGAGASHPPVTGSELSAPQAVLRVTVLGAWAGMNTSRGTWRDLGGYVAYQQHWRAGAA